MIGWALDPAPTGSRFLGPCCVRCGVAAPPWIVTAAERRAADGQITCGICVEARREIARRSSETAPSFDALSEER